MNCKMVLSNIVTATMLHTLLILTIVYGAPMKQWPKKKSGNEAPVPPYGEGEHIENFETDETENLIDEAPINVEPCGCPLPNIPQLTQQQKDLIVRKNDTIQGMKANPDSWSSRQFVIINEDQKQAILAHYRGLFRDVSERPLRRSVNGKTYKEDTRPVCPSRSEESIPTLAINSHDNVVQVVQFPEENQVFMEEKCSVNNSNIIDAECQDMWNARQNAFVIDFTTGTFERQAIKMRSCVALKSMIANVT